MPGAMPYSHWSVLPGKMTSMRLISRHRWSEDRELKCRHRPTRADSMAVDSAQQISGARGVKTVSKPAKPILGPEASAALRDRLLMELNAIGSSDDATSWAHRILSGKNSLIAADARQVEDAFRGQAGIVGTAADISDAPLSPVLSALRPSSSVERRSPEPAGEPPLPTASTRASWSIPSRAAFVTRPTSSSWPNSRA